MRKKIALLLAAVMAAGLCACQKEPAETTAQPTLTEVPATETTEATEPARENKLVYGADLPFNGDLAAGLFAAQNPGLPGAAAEKSLDKLAGELLSDCNVIALLPDGSWAYNSTVLAEEPVWQDQPDGSRVYTLKIRENLRYNTGKNITARDFVLGMMLENSAAAVTLGDPGASGERFAGGKEFHSGSTAVFTGLHLLGDYSYSVTLSPETMPCTYAGALLSAAPWDAACWLGEGYVVQDDGKGCYLALDGSPVRMDSALALTVRDRFTAARSGRTVPLVTAGPYQLRSADLEKGQIVLEINPSYSGNFRGSRPSVEVLVLDSGADPDMLRAGEVDLLDADTDIRMIHQALEVAQSRGDLTVREYPRPGYGKLHFVCDSTPAQFPEVRRAIAHLVDRQLLLDVYCGGRGEALKGPFHSGLWMEEPSRQRFDRELELYSYDPEAAAALLDQGGWTLNAQGEAWTGEGLRYKAVTPEQAAHMEDCVEADGQTLMPLLIRWGATPGNPVSDAMEAMLMGEEAGALGMEVLREDMDFPRMMQHLCRRPEAGGDEPLTRCAMYSLAERWNGTIFDDTARWTRDPEQVAAGYNLNYLFETAEDSLLALSEKLARHAPEGDREGWLAAWQDYVLAFSRKLPDLPLYADRCVSVCPGWLENYTPGTFWDFGRAIVEAVPGGQA